MINKSQSCCGWQQNSQMTWLTSRTPGYEPQVGNWLISDVFGIYKENKCPQVCPNAFMRTFIKVVDAHHKYL